MRFALTLLVLSFPLLITAGALMSYPELPQEMTVDANTTAMDTRGQQIMMDTRSAGTESSVMSSEERPRSAEKNHIR